MSDGYRFKLLDLTPDDFRRTSELLRICFPAARHLTPRYLDWNYARNPDGKAVGCNAFHNDELVGHMSSIALRTRIEGREVRGLFMVNGAIHPAHRGRKLQSKISHAMFEEATSQGYSFILGTGNKYSTGPLLTRFRLIAPLGARLGYGIPKRREDDLVPAFERLWSDEALRWRLANPERAYRVEHSGSTMAIIAASGTRGVGAILYSGSNEWDLPVQGRDLRGQGPLKVWIGLDPTIDWKRSAYLSIPRRLRPSPLNLVFRDLAGGMAPPDAARMAFRAIDFDPY